MTLGPNKNNLMPYSLVTLYVCLLIVEVKLRVKSVNIPPPRQFVTLCNR